MKGISNKTWRKDSSLFASTTRRRMAKTVRTQPQSTSHNDAAKAMGAMMRELGV